MLTPEKEKIVAWLQQAINDITTDVAYGAIVHSEEEINTQISENTEMITLHVSYLKSIA